MVVIGDRSGSMEVAIRTSTIIASLLTALCSAKLVFFDDKNMEAPFIPTNIEEVGNKASGKLWGNIHINVVLQCILYECVRRNLYVLKTKIIHVVAYVTAQEVL